ncbi:MAG: ATP-dependent helicase [Phycisphaeraceae bacterium]|nr:ATP-dependent helicase [Phycisphaeraceae bacterium]
MSTEPTTTLELNDEQRAAAHHTGGPLAVLAGPGTGKTRVIIARIAHLIRERGVAPEGIVALTFTTKSAEEMRGRLAALVGGAVASRVQAHTFNGYGYRLLRRHADRLGLPARLEMIDAVEAHRMMSGIILERGLFGTRRPEGVPALTGFVLSWIEKFANMGRAPRDVMETARAWRERLGEAVDDDEEARAQRVLCDDLTDAASAYEAYNAARRARGLLGYSDQVVLPLELLRDDAAARALVRASVKAVIVDEFQDCSQAQIDLLSLITDASRRGGADLCAVGDDDQAIYGFRGADNRAFGRFKAAWPDHDIVRLTLNYRSHPEIVDLSNRVISRAFARFAPDKALSAQSRATGRAVGLITLENDKQDGETIAAHILHARETRTPCPEWSSFAVIARTHGHLDEISAALSLCGIPCSRKRATPIFADDGVADVRAWIAWLHEPDAAWPAMRLLRRPPFSLPPEVVARCDSEYRAARSHAEHGLPDSPDPGPYPAWLRAFAGSLPPEHADMVRRCCDRYDALREAVQAKRADDALHAIILATDAAHADLLPSRERATRIRAVLGLLQLARARQARLPQPGGLEELRAYLDELEDLNPTGQVPTLEDADGEDLDDQPGNGTSPGEQGVQLMTAHASKGLEFDTVFVPRVTPPHGYPKMSRDDEPPPPVESIDPDAQPEAERALDEERRLFYVACTRARNELVLLAKRGKNPSGTKAAHFFEELAPHGGQPLVGVLMPGEQVRRMAGEKGVGPAHWRAGGGAGTEQETGGPEEARRRDTAAARMRRQARVAIAAALERADSPDLSPQDVTRAQEDVERALHQFLAAGQLLRRGDLPEWVGGGERENLRAQWLATTRADQPAGDGPVMRPPAPPLRLSYSAVETYRRCPRCYYVSRVMGLSQRTGEEVDLGNVAHMSLERFYQRWSVADAEGEPRPGLSELLSIARGAYRTLLSQTGNQARPEVLDQLLAQLKGAYERLHDERTQVLEVEHDVRFEYVVDGVAHHFHSRLDRIDLLPDGTHRVVDYKTGDARKKLREIAEDDLQMGVYLLALGHVLGEERPQGRAEYWLLSTGERGAIEFSGINLDKVRREIDAAVRGILAGEFPRGAPRDCRGDCLFLERA